MSKNLTKTEEEHEQDLVNTYFVQLNKRNMQQWRALVRKSPVATELMYLFMEHMNNENAIIVSYQAMMELTGASRATVARGIKLLKEGNWIETVKLGGSTAYVVNERVAWQTYANKREYAIFRATVLAAGSENQEIKEQPRKQLKRPPILMHNEVPIMRDERLDPPDQSEMDV